MKSLTYRRLVPIAWLMFTCGLLLTSLSLLLDAPVPEKFLVMESSTKVFALLDVGKGRKLVAHEQYREGVREWFTLPEMPWFLLRFSPTAKLNVVQSQKDAEAWLKKNLHAEYVGKTDRLRVWLTDGSPQEQAIIVDTIVRGFLQDVQRNTIPFLKEEIALSRRFLAASAQAIAITETDLRKLVNSVAFNMSKSQLRAFCERLCNLVREFTFHTKHVKLDRAQIEEAEAVLRTQPRIVKWAGKPGPEE
jgi:hypothetical protein